jgi:hypothetical protein
MPHHVHDHLRRECQQRVPQILLAVNSIGGGDAQVEHEERHGHGENAVAKGGEALDALAGDLIAVRGHRRRKDSRRGGGAKSLCENAIELRRCGER